VIKDLSKRISLQPIPMDKITPEFVTGKRIPAIASNASMSKIEKLAEVNFYFDKGFLDEKQRKEAFVAIAGELGESLLSDSSETRESAIKELLDS
jgi:hypothetical protein